MTTPWSFVLRAHADSRARILCTSISPEGSVLACGCADQSIKIFDMETGRKLVSFADHPYIPIAITFAPDGSLYTASAKGELLHFGWDSSQATESKIESLTQWKTQAMSQEWYSNNPVTLKTVSRYQLEDDIFRKTFKRLFGRTKVDVKSIMTINVMEPNHIWLGGMDGTVRRITRGSSKLRIISSELFPVMGLHPVINGVRAVYANGEVIDKFPGRWISGTTKITESMGHISAAALSQNDLVIYGTREGDLLIKNVRNHEVQARVHAADSDISTVAFWPDTLHAHSVVVSASESTASIWTVSDE